VFTQTTSFFVGKENVDTKTNNFLFTTFLQTISISAH